MNWRDDPTVVEQRNDSASANHQQNGQISKNKESSSSFKREFHWCDVSKKFGGGLAIKRCVP